MGRYLGLQYMWYVMCNRGAMIETLDFIDMEALSLLASSIVRGAAFKRSKMNVTE